MLVETQRVQNRLKSKTNPGTLDTSLRHGDWVAELCVLSDVTNRIVSHNCNHLDGLGSKEFNFRLNIHKNKGLGPVLCRPVSFWHRFTSGNVFNTSPLPPWALLLPYYLMDLSSRGDVRRWVGTAAVHSSNWSKCDKSEQLGFRPDVFFVSTTSRAPKAAVLVCPAVFVKAWHTPSRFGNPVPNERLILVLSSFYFSPLCVALQTWWICVYFLPDFGPVFCLPI